MKDSNRSQDRQWFIDNFAPASQLESKLIPDILGRDVCPREALLLP